MGDRNFPLKCAVSYQSACVCVSCKCSMFLKQIIKVAWYLFTSDLRCKQSPSNYRLYWTRLLSFSDLGLSLTVLKCLLLFASQVIYNRYTLGHLHLHRRTFGLKVYCNIASKAASLVFCTQDGRKRNAAKFHSLIGDGLPHKLSGSGVNICFWYAAKRKWILHKSA